MLAENVKWNIGTKKEEIWRNNVNKGGRKEKKKIEEKAKKYK